MTGLAPKTDDDDDDDDEDDDQWLIGESLDGSKSGTFPASHILASQASEEAADSIPTASQDNDNDGASNTEKVIDQEIGLPDHTPVSSSQPIDKETTVEADQPPQGITEPAPTPAKPASPKEEVVQKPISPTSLQTDVSSVRSTASPVSPSSSAPPERKLSSPPPAAPKPSGLAARIAAFNKPQEGPPPLPKGKPGAWKRPPPAPGGPKPVVPGPPAAQQSKQLSGSEIGASTPTQLETTPASVIESQTSKSNTGFSAADAQSSIKMSLKERMAALQRGEQRSEAGAGATQSTKPGRINEEKRSAALASMGTSKEAAPSDKKDEAASDKVSDTEAFGRMDPDPTVESTENKSDLEDEVNEGDGEREVSEEPPEDTKTEEEQAAERRAAIAKRMAALGGQRMGGGPAVFGAPAPKPKKQSTDDSTPAEEPKSSVEPLQEAPLGEEEPQSAKSETLSVPRRTAPPRKKKSSSASSTQQPPSDAERQKTVDSDASGTAAVKKEATEEESSEDAGAIPVSEDTQAKVDLPVAGIAAAAGTTGVASAAAGAGILSSEQQLTEEPEAASSEAYKQPDELQESAAAHRTPSIVEPSSNDEPSAGDSDRNAVDVSSAGDVHSVAPDETFEPSTPVSQSELEEHARQLEAFVRTPETESRQNSVSESFQDEKLDDKSEDDYLAQDNAEERESYPSLPRPSSRPPVPKTPNIPSDDQDIDRITSPAPTRAPPVPAATRRQGSLASADDTNHSDDTSHAKGIAGAAAIAGGVAATAVAAPMARKGVAADLSESEGEEEEEGHNEAKETTKETKEAGADPNLLQNQEEQVLEPQDEEESERLRKSRLAERMARMGAQPIMGAPMPFRKAPVPASRSAETEDTVTTEGKDEQESEQPPPSTFAAPLANPPPVPNSPPPAPQVSSSRSKRLSSSTDDQAIPRPASIHARPPIPVTHSREATEEKSDEDEQEPYTSSPPPKAPTSPPPRAPMSPPPRPPSRAPPTRQGSVAEPVVRQGSVSEAVNTEQKAVEDEPTSSQETSLKPVQPSAPSSRDLDLMPSSQWWRHGLPVKLPPSLLRPDAVHTVSTQDDRHHHLIRVDLVFEDYSSTTVTVLYQNDDGEETHTQLAQQHHFAPGRPSAQQLVSWSQQYGCAVAKHASSFVANKGTVAAHGDGSSRSVIGALLSTATHDEVLPPVGASFGAIVLAQAATTAVDVGADEIRAGDIVALHGADFKGKKGLTPYHVTYGSTNEPALACVIEVDSAAKKRKLRCALVATSASRKVGQLEEISLRLDDVKSGLLRVFRVVPRRGWLS